MLVYRAASWSGANRSGCATAASSRPGWRADLVLLDDLENAASERHRRRPSGRGRALRGARALAPVGLDSISGAAGHAATIFVSTAAAQPTPVIGVTPGRIITQRLELPWPAITARSADPAQDVIKVAVVARHGKNDNIGRGFVTASA